MSRRFFITRSYQYQLYKTANNSIIKKIFLFTELRSSNRGGNFEQYFILNDSSEAQDLSDYIQDLDQNSLESSDFFAVLRFPFLFRSDQTKNQF